MSDLYVIERRTGSGGTWELSYWRGDSIWVTDRRSALQIAGYNVAVPIAGILSMIVDGDVTASYDAVGQTTGVKK